MNDGASIKDVLGLPSLDTLIREALDASASPDPMDAVDDVLHRISVVDYTHYLRTAIAARMAAVVSTARGNTTPGIRRGVSTKQSIIRDQYWPSFLRQRIFLAQGYKFLAEATSEDLRAVAAQRASQAQELLFRSEQFETLADLMDKAKVKHLEELDSAAGTQVLERAA